MQIMVNRLSVAQTVPKIGAKTRANNRIPFFIFSIPKVQNTSNKLNSWKLFNYLADLKGVYYVNKGIFNVKDRFWLS